LTPDVKGINLNVVKKYWWLGAILLLVPALVRADGMSIYPIGKVVTETGQRAVIWYEKGRETLILSTTFRGDAEDFAWVIPVPTKPEVSNMKDELFTALEEFTQPKYAYNQPMPLLGSAGIREMDSAIQNPVTVVESKIVDIYEVTVLESTDGKALREWLTKNGYPYPTNKDFLLNYYVNKKWYFVAAKVSTEALGYSGASLREGHATPLAISFDSETIVYPLKISGAGSKFNEADKIGAFSFENGTEGFAARGRTVLNDKSVHTSLAMVSREWKKYGNFSLKISNASETVSDDYATRYVNKLKPGSDYIVSAYAYSDSGVKVKLVLAENGVTLSESNTVTLPNTKEGTRLELPFTANTGSTSLELFASGLETGQAVYWDGVQLETGGKSSEFDQEVIPGNTTTDNQYQTINLYVFADHKKEIPGFQTNFAGWTTADEIKRMGYDDAGKPWVDAKKKMYLTKLSRSMSQAQMTDDLTLRDAVNNDAVGNSRSSLVLDDPTKVALVFGIPILAEAGLFGWWWNKEKRRLAA